MAAAAPAGIQSQRKKDKLPHEGFVYVFAQLSRDLSTEFWRCQHKNSNPKCLAGLHRSIETGVITVKGVHSDFADATGVEVQRNKTTLKRRAADTVERPLQVVDHVRASCSIAAHGAMESNKSLARIVQRTRNALGISSMIFKILADIDLPAEYRRYEVTDGNFEEFLLGDTGSNDPTRILMFGRRSAGSWIGTVEKQYVDGTFSVVPELFAQLLIILAERPTCVVPICFVLLPNKTPESYCKVRFQIDLMYGDAKHRYIPFYEKFTNCRRDPMETLKTVYIDRSQFSGRERSTSVY